MDKYYNFENQEEYLTKRDKYNMKTTFYRKQLNKYMGDTQPTTEKNEKGINGVFGPLQMTGFYSVSGKNDFDKRSVSVNSRMTQ